MQGDQLFEAAGSSAAGGHLAAIDFWESRAEFDAFQGGIGQAAAAAGVQMQGPPEIEEFPVHETFSGR